MAIDMERILKLTADYHHFCLDVEAQSEKRDLAPDELTVDDLDLIAAAANIPWDAEKPDAKK